MGIGAVLVLVTGQITIPGAIGAIKPDVMLFLFCMFVVGAALEKSGYLYTLAYRVFRRSDTGEKLVFSLVIVMGLLSAVLMNDTLAVIGTPLVLYFARKFDIPAGLLLISLCFAITTGSVMSPIGNPQNLLIALNSGIGNPFLSFMLYLGIPTIVSLVLAYLVIRYLYRREFPTGKKLIHEEAPPGDPGLARLSKVSLILILGLSLITTAWFFISSSLLISLPLIALVAALPILVLSPRRFEVVRTIDWPTLIFFAAMFVLMQSVYQTGVLQAVVDIPNAAVPATLFATSLIISQFISNVPFVALFLPAISEGGLPLVSSMALAAGSTLAGNLTILGAASNVIVVQNAEKEGETISFIQFLKVGIPFTILSSVVYLLYFSMFQS
ncbi:MAG: anion transporter [Methanoregulaceae archaeon]|nr:anion transporter [Methanoregulaceae archaeon]